MLCQCCRHALRLRLINQNSSIIFYKPRSNSALSIPYRPIPFSKGLATNAARQAGAGPSSRQPGASPSSDSSTPSAISSSTPGISQPLSTPEFPSTSSSSTAPSNPPADSARRVLTSFVPGGQELKGLGYTKEKQTVLAKEDSEYPHWLWTLLEEDPAKTGKGGVGPDVTAMTKKQRIKYEKKQAALKAQLPRVIPVHEQSIDLTAPGTSASEHRDKADEVTESMRRARRKGIREANYLRSM